jgi:hypothetical protein
VQKTRDNSEQLNIKILFKLKLKKNFNKNVIALLASVGFLKADIKNTTAGPPAAIFSLKHKGPVNMVSQSYYRYLKSKFAY